MVVILDSSDDVQFSGHSCDDKNLKVFRSDPFDYQSILDALKGCCGLFYTFEPPRDQPTYDVSASISSSVALSVIYLGSMSLRD